MEILLMILIIVVVISTTVAGLEIYENKQLSRILEIQTELNNLVTELTIKTLEKNNK